MRIAAVTVTCERITLLARALKSIKEQTRDPDLVYVISNSKSKTFLEEQRICAEFGFPVIKNHRTENYAGALNTAIEEIVKLHGVEDDIYFASLDDDDIWLNNKLKKQLDVMVQKKLDFIMSDYIINDMINNTNYKKLLQSGAKYIAISSYIWDNPKLKPETAIRKFK